MSEQRVLGGIFPPLHLNPTASVLRVEDFLALGFEFVNLQVSTPSPGKPVLTIVNRANPAFIVVTFPPQNIAEQAFWLAAETFHVLPPHGQPPDPPATETPDRYTAADGPFLSGKPRPLVRSRIAGASRLVFAVPVNSDPIPYSLQSLLEKCSEFALSLAPPAVASPIFGVPTRHLAGMEAIKTAVVTVSTVAGPAGTAPRAAAVSLADLIVQHRTALQAARSLTLKRVHGAATANNLAAGVTVAPQPAELAGPTLTQTAIEMPYRLIISPSQYGAWAHASVPISSQTGRTELWHTRLGVRLPAGGPIDESAAMQSLRFFRAIWTARDRTAPTVANAPPHDESPFRTSLDAFDRWNIVHQSHDGAAITANRMMLTSLGGWLDARGTWGGQEIEEWRHVATMGRDHYARVIYRGFLFPFGHGASLVKITERVFHHSLPGNPAYLRQRVFIVVREHEKFYHQNEPAVIDMDQHRFDLQMPFPRVRITTMVTPNLDEPAAPDTLSRFCPRVGGADFQFHLIAEDLDGKEVEFKAPLYFVDASASGDLDPSVLQTLIDDYPNQPKQPNPRGVCDFHGRRVPFAQGSDPNAPKDIKPGSTTFETTSVTFSARPLDDAHLRALAWGCHFYPAVTSAKIIVPALKHLAGNTESVEVKYFPAYLQNGFANKGQVFLEMASKSDPGAAVGFSKQGDRSGGLVTPNMQVTALSRLLGPVAGSPATISGGNFKPDDFFAALGNAKLFGTIPLTAVLKELGLDDPSKLPRFVMEGLSKLEGLLQDVATAQDLMETVSKEIDGAAAALGAKAATLKDDVKNVWDDLKLLATTDFPRLVSDPKSAAPDFIRHLNDLVGHLQTLLADLPALNAVADAKRSLQQILSRFSQEVAAAGSILETLLAEQLTIKFVWNPVIQPIDISFKSLKDGDDPDTALFWPKADSFKISVEMQVAKTAAEPAMDIYCGLRDFKLQLIGKPNNFVTLHFDALEFTVSTGKSPDVNVKLASDGITFDGPLKFVNTLRELIPFDGFSDPPALTVNAQGISASFSVGLPTVGIGVFSLQNMSLGAGFKVPFIGDPLEVDFNFCSREQPFLLTVSLFGGGGYFLMKATPDGVGVEAALEFGAAVSVNLGVASGGLHVIAGIYFSMQPDHTVLLGGFVRMGGNVDVLGLISASIELDMELEWFIDSGSVIGSATITVEVHVLFFSAGVSISCQKQFAGSSAQPAHAAAIMAFRTTAIAAAPGGAGPMPESPAQSPDAAAIPPPTFKDLMQPDAAGAPWRDYCRAFT